MNDIPVQSDLIEEAPVALILKLYCVFAVSPVRFSDSSDEAAVSVCGLVQDPCREPLGVIGQFARVEQYSISYAPATPEGAVHPSVTLVAV